MISLIARVRRLPVENALMQCPTQYSSLERLLACLCEISTWLEMLERSVLAFYCLAYSFALNDFYYMSIDAWRSDCW